LPLSRYLKNSFASYPGGLWNKNVIGVRFLRFLSQIDSYGLMTLSL
jgi:hypothetical protein